MNVNIKRPFAALLCTAMVAGPMPVRADETIRCESPNFRYRYCRVNTDNRVELRRQISSTSCREGRNWGYESRGIWVDHGCGAEFRVGGRGGGHSDRAVVGAVAGLAIIAALASSNHQQKAETSSEVPAWAVGTFTGFDNLANSDVTVTIVPGGSVRGRAGGSEFTGSFTTTRLEAGRRRFSVERSGNGFIATDENNSSQRVVFSRTDGGY